MYKFCLLLFIFIPNFDAVPTELERDFSRYFDEFGVTGSFVLYDLQKDTYIRYDPERCKEAFSPASTFKIPNSLIALEEGIVQDENTVMPWDGEKRSIEAWNQDLSFRDAFRFSCVPCYIQIAQQLGNEAYQRYLPAMQYGNEDPSGSPRNAFWLDGNLRISQEQQINFLRKLYHHELPFSHRSINIVKAIMVDEKEPGYVLSGKTGWNDETHGKDIGWYVGYLEKENQVYFFALNIESPEAGDNFIAARKAITKNILKELRLI